MNSWEEAEDMRRRCEEHGRKMAANPEAAEFARDWADLVADEMMQR